MEYCSLQDAFPEIGGGPAPTGCSGNKAGSIARKEERKKAKKCKGPPLTFLEGSGDAPLTDPDRPSFPQEYKAIGQNTGSILGRPALIPLPETPPLNKATGLIEHAPVDAPPQEPFTDYNASDPMYFKASYLSQEPPSDEKELNTMPSNVAGPNQALKANFPKFFGANYDDDSNGNSIEEGFASFTNIIGDDPNYRLSPDFTSAFAGKGADKASGVEVLPIPSVKNVWKPLTPSGARTSFFDKLPSPGGDFPIGPLPPSYDKEELFRRLDSIYARLDDLEVRRGENAQTETLLFVMSGIFVLFSMDLIVRKTGNVRIAK